MHGTDPAPSATAGGDLGHSRSRRPIWGVPTGRALVGGLLVTLAAVMVFAAYAGAQERPTSTVVVARHDLDPGRPITVDDVEVRTIDVPTEVAERSFGDAAEVAGAVTLGPIAAGELVQQGSIRTGATGADGPEFSFPIDRELALAGDIHPGEQVELLATFGSGSDATTVVLAPRARILHVQDARSGTLGSTGRLVLTVALASTDQVVDVAHASQVAVITAVRPSTATGSAASDAPPATGEGR